MLRLHLSVLFFLLCAPAWSAAAPVHSFDCKNCHLTGKTINELGGDNVCLACHGVAPPAGTSGFVTGDASARFGNNPAPGDETSHNWAAVSRNPAAGAVDPVRDDYPGFFSNYGTTVGRVACTRCHQPHGNSETNPKLLTTTASGYAAFNAAPLSPSEMCLACHLPWDQSDNHGWLTHPIVDDYNASVLAQPGKYKDTLDNRYNAAIQLVNGGVSCTSCHGIHFADSDSLTTDGPGELLSKSDGTLLRANGPSRSDKSSLCQTCHMYTEHGSAAGELVGCLVCHSGHSYDPVAPNYYVLRKIVNTVTFGVKTGLDYSSPEVLNSALTYTYWNDQVIGTDNGYCERCHGDMADIDIVPGTKHQTDADCIQCHIHNGTNQGSFGPDCLGCHSVAQGGRSAITSQFKSNSHHIQGVEVTAELCYQCHWEANNDGSVNTVYHAGGAFLSGEPVDLVIYGAGARPTAYTLGVSAIEYVANGLRPEIEELNDHCLGCHSEQNNSTEPFGDGKTPQHYAWDRNAVSGDQVNDHLIVDADGTSIASRYSQTATTTWGKYATYTNAAKKNVQKAYSAHGNAGVNAGGWDPTTGVDGAITNTRANKAPGSSTIACFDCHNSHGSTVSGRATSYNSATLYGGILKDTQSGTGGYSVTYQPSTGGSAGEKNAYNPGAGLCFDCHMNRNSGGGYPWGYQSTFGANSAILGYTDPPYFTSTGAGNQTRYAYKNALNNKGGHFGASSSLYNSAMGSIDGLCTPCHDPHGVTPNFASGNQKYAVPLLKGTWLTSPYKDDVAPQTNTQYTGYLNSATLAPHDRHVYIDQNTFGSHFNEFVTGIVETEEQFAGLCLGCHPKSSLTKDGSGTANQWKSKDRVHESVANWKSSAGDSKHAYSCSKCHAPHSAGQPRLMVTNCMDSSHKGRVASTNNPITSYYEYTCNEGEGIKPGEYYFNQSGDCLAVNDEPSASVSLSCHEGKTGGQINQRWNNLTPWGTPPPRPQNATSTPSGDFDSLCNATPVTIQWDPVTSPDGHDVIYYILYTITTKTLINQSKPWPATAYNSGWLATGTTSYTVPQLLPPGQKLTWNIKARDNQHSYIMESLWSGGFANDLEPDPYCWE